MLSRRRVLELFAVALPGLALGCDPSDPDAVAFDPDAVPESVERFPRTPIVGDMTSTRVVITFFVADDSPVTLRMWTDEDVVVDQQVEASGDGFHKVMIDDLDPGARYHYAVFSGEAPEFTDRSLICTFKTAPAAGDLPIVRFGLLCCIGQGTVIPDFYFPDTLDFATAEPFQWAIFDQVKDRDLDFVVHLGDQAYLDYVWSDTDATVADYLDAWGYYHGGGYRDVYPYAGLYATWDDHESTDNKFFDPWDLSPEDAEKLGHAQTAWYKVVPIDAMTPDDATVWRAFRWGDTVELILLDCRYELEPDKMMSEAQLDWLIERLEQSPCRFVCVATPKPFAQITTSIELPTDNADRWAGYDAQRSRLAAVLDDGDMGHVVFVTGDIHMNYLGNATIDGTAPSELAWEICCSSGNTNPTAPGLSSEQFAFVGAKPHLPVLTFDPEGGTVDVEFYDMDGELAFQRTLEA